MKFVEPLYPKDMKEKVKNRLINRVLHKKVLPKHLLLIMRLENNNLMEIVDSDELYRLDKLEQNIYILGFAKDVDEAISFITEISENVVCRYQQIDKLHLLKEYNING